MFFYCSYNKYCYFLLRCGPRTKFPQCWEKWNTKKTLFDIFSTKKSDLSLSSLFMACSVSTGLETITVFDTYLDVGWDQCGQSPRRNLTLLCSLLNFIVLQACLQLAFYVLFLKQVLFSYLFRCGLRTKFPESLEDYSSYKCLFGILHSAVWALQFS